MPSIQEKLATSGNRPAGFDYMRLILATGVIAQHTVNVSYGQASAVAMFHSPARVVWGPILPMFFALSGFLVAGSLERNRSLIGFLGLRAIRLAPALACEVTLSALVLGPALTILSLQAYVASPEFRAYFLNILGLIHYHLPGLFLNNPLPRMVNAQLWTIPAELKCYIALGALGFFGVISRKSLTIWILIVMQVSLLILALKSWASSPDVVPIPALVGCFLAGVCGFRMRESLRLNVWAALGAAAIVGVLLLTPHGDWLLPIPAAYLTVFLGTLNPKRNKVLLSGDYSYGLYLYGYPIQQAVATQPWSHAWWINFLVAYPLAFALATASWWLVEKPAMGLKKFLYVIEDFGLRQALISWHSRHVFRMASAPPH